jgi:glucose-6-phosphate 1-dehydrogenase
VELERFSVDPTALVVVGATGNLAQRKLLPVVYNLAHGGVLPEFLSVVGVVPSDHRLDKLCSLYAASIDRFSRRRARSPLARRAAGRVALRLRIVGRRRGLPAGATDAGVSRRARRPRTEPGFALATAPEFFPLSFEKLAEAGLQRAGDAQTRIPIEKPFGVGLASARTLKGQVLAVFEESHVFRIDHHPARETVQNLIAVRFATTVCEPVGTASSSITSRSPRRRASG